MWIRRVKIQNYSTFKDSGWIDLVPGINLFVGQNNSGKSALLKAIALQLDQNPHRSTEAYTPSEIETPVFELDVSSTPREIVKRLKDLDKDVIFPVPGGPKSEQQPLLDILAEPDAEVILEGIKYPGKTIEPRHGASIKALRRTGHQARLRVDWSGNQLKPESNPGSSSDTLLSFLDAQNSEAVFYFNPERLNVARYGFATESRLKPDASNLPAVLAYLQGRRRLLLDKIEQQLVDIMPGIARLTITPSENTFEILLWPDRETDRHELAFSLADSGTGVGQLLAILTAVAVSEQAVVVIDEINTFLHPSAAKQLMGLLRSDYDRHQYIISTHSPDIITSAATDNVYLLRRSGFRSAPEKIDLKDIEGARRIAGALGFSMMDVFGSDRIIWVEGKTEEICFPFLLRKKRGELPDDIGFAPVSSTDDFGDTRASAKKITQIYDSVAASVAPLLKGMAFGLDRESLSDESVQSLQRSKRKLKFLPRRCIECFCLQPSAIAQILNDLGERELDQVDIEEWLLNHGGEKIYKAKSVWSGDLDNNDWLKKVDAARLLKDLFSDLTSARQEFRKTRDTFEILKFIAENDVNKLDELIEFIELLVEVAHRESKP